ncbi:MAG: MFS transporter [Proteobacteria bacterium]|nr:MFS transporter [Pseudomonadota bacterium]
MSLYLRLSLYYAASIGSLSFIPFLSLMLADRAIDDRAIAATLALLPAGRLMGGTSWAWVADRLGRPQLILRLATGSAALLGVAVLVAPTPLLLAAALLSFSFMRAPQFPIVDALALQRLGGGYGSVRAWGSLAYLLLVLAASTLRTVDSNGPLAAAVVLLFITAMVAWTLPPGEQPSSPPGWAQIKTLISDRTIGLVLMLSLIQGMTITPYDTLFTLHISRLSLPETVASVAIAVGVAGEIGVMAAGRRLLDRIGPAGLLVLAAVSGLPRWAVTAWSTDPTLLIAAQLLHALGFGAFWIGGTRLVAERAPKGLASTAQSLFPAAGWGFGYLASMGVAGVLLPLGGPPAVFTASLALSVVATVLALRLTRL